MSVVAEVAVVAEAAAAEAVAVVVAAVAEVAAAAATGNAYPAKPRGQDPDPLSRFFESLGRAPSDLRGGSLFSCPPVFRGMQ